MTVKLFGSPALGAHTRIGSQKDLQVGIGQHDRSDISTFHNDSRSTVSDVRALKFNQMLANSRHSADRTHGVGDSSTTNRVRHVNAVNFDSGIVGIGATDESRWLVRRENARDRGGILGIDARLQDGPRDGPIHRTGIQIVETQTGSDRPAHARLPRTGWAIDRDDESRGHGRQAYAQRIKVKP